MVLLDALDRVKWFLVLITLYVVLALYVRRFQSRPGAAQLPTQTAPSTQGHSRGRGHVLFVTAHPDDEAMFFVPTIRNLAPAHDLSLLCLSSGDADGLGEVRKKELVKAGAVLGFETSAVRVVEHEGLPDGMRTEWSPELVAEIVEREVRAREIDVIITFDVHGVSGHWNHIAVHHGVRQMLKRQQQGQGRQCDTTPRVRAFALVTTGILRKYLGLLDAPLSVLSERCYASIDPALNYRAMQAHFSQFVWYRRLFVLFSRYTFLNTLVEMDG